MQSFIDMANRLIQFSPQNVTEYQRNTTVVPKNVPGRMDMLDAIMRGMSRPKRDNGDLPAGRSVMTAMAQDPNKKNLNPMATTEGARAYVGGAKMRDNPYPRGTADYTRWRTEFWDAQAPNLRSEPSK